MSTTQTRRDEIREEIKESFGEKRELLELVAESDTPLRDRAAAVLDILDQDDDE